MLRPLTAHQAKQPPLHHREWLTRRLLVARWAAQNRFNCSLSSSLRCAATQANCSTPSSFQMRKLPSVLLSSRSSKGQCLGLTHHPPLFWLTDSFNLIKNTAIGCIWASLTPSRLWNSFKCTQKYIIRNEHKHAMPAILSTNDLICKSKQIAAAPNIQASRWLTKFPSQLKPHCPHTKTQKHNKYTNARLFSTKCSNKEARPYSAPPGDSSGRQVAVAAYVLEETSTSIWLHNKY